MKCVDVVSDITDHHDDKVTWELDFLMWKGARIIKVEKIKRDWFGIGNIVTRILYEDNN